MIAVIAAIGCAFSNFATFWISATYDGETDMIAGPLAGRVWLLAPIVGVLSGFAASGRRWTRILIAASGMAVAAVMLLEMIRILASYPEILAENYSLVTGQLSGAAARNFAELDPSVYVCLGFVVLTTITSAILLAVSFRKAVRQEPV